jgi:hypothetical protein
MSTETGRFSAKKSNMSEITRGLSPKVFSARRTRPPLPFPPKLSVLTCICELTHPVTGPYLECSCGRVWEVDMRGGTAHG